MDSRAGNEAIRQVQQTLLLAGHLSSSFECITTVAPTDEMVILCLMFRGLGAGLHSGCIVYVPISSP